MVSKIGGVEVKRDAKNEELAIQENKEEIFELEEDQEEPPKGTVIKVFKLSGSDLHAEERR